MGTSYRAMLAEVRLNMACQLLADSGKPLSDVAKFLGYSSASSFSRTFARLMKVQPVVYRRQQLAGKHQQASHRRRLCAIDS
ncbi:MULTISPECIES: AraC family transcriptional regulator [Bradyrhizobium]|nr:MULTISPECIES: AraC family transcriptional regulator [Bradyrhizobium]